MFCYAWTYLIEALVMFRHNMLVQIHAITYRSKFVTIHTSLGVVSLYPAMSQWYFNILPTLLTSPWS